MKGCLRSAHIGSPNYSKQLASKPLRLPSSSGKEALGSDIISGAGHQHENTPTMVNVGMCSWCTNCHRCPPAAASARRTSSAMTKQHKYLNMFMCIYERAPGIQRQQHEPICMCVVRLQRNDKTRKSFHILAVFCARFPETRSITCAQRGAFLCLFPGLNIEARFGDAWL